MFADFSLRHVPALAIATGVIFGGLMPFFNAENAISTFGFPKHVAVSKPAQSVMFSCAGRLTAFGLALLAFYFRGNYEAVDTILTILGYVDMVDAYACWREGSRNTAVTRVISGTFASAWGWFGMTTGNA